MIGIGMELGSRPAGILRLMLGVDECRHLHGRLATPPVVPMMFLTFRPP